jgi:hypothetical protein
MEGGVSKMSVIAKPRKGRPRRENGPQRQRKKKKSLEVIVIKLIIIICLLINSACNHYMFIRISRDNYMCRKWFTTAAFSALHSSSQLPLGSSIAYNNTRDVSVGNAALVILSRISLEMVIF